MAGTAPTKQLLICHECYNWGHVVPEYIISPYNQKQMIANYETLSPAGLPTWETKFKAS